MSYIEPNLGQSQANIKILQEIEEQKRRIMRQSSSSPTNFDNLTTSSSPTTQATNTLQQLKPLNNTINANTFGYFVNTDSVYGNNILPVLPRF